MCHVSITTWVLVVPLFLILLSLFLRDLFYINLLLVHLGYHLDICSTVIANMIAVVFERVVHHQFAVGSRDSVHQSVLHNLLKIKISHAQSEWRELNSVEQRHGRTLMECISKRLLTFYVREIMITCLLYITSIKSVVLMHCLQTGMLSTGILFWLESSVL